MQRTLLSFGTFALAALTASSAWAADFAVRPGTSSISFTSSAILETITGTSSQVEGTISTELSNPSATTASVAVPTGSLRTGNDMRDEHLWGGDWLNAEANPHIRFDITGVTVPDGAALTHGQALQATVAGTLSIKGQSQAVSTPATVTYYQIDDPELAGTYGIDGNVLRVQSTFTVSLSDYGISVPAPLRTKVSNEIEVTIRLTAVEG
jgi:polyisoprenoid-binding protein YceI